MLPSTAELYQSRSREEDLISLRANASFRIHRAPISVAQTSSISDSRSKQAHAAIEEPQEELFDENSIFADYFGSLPSTATAPQPSNSAPIVDDEVSVHVPSTPPTETSEPEIPILVTRLPLSELMSHSSLKSSSSAPKSTINSQPIDSDDEEMVLRFSRSAVPRIAAKSSENDVQEDENEGAPVFMNENMVWTEADLEENLNSNSGACSSSVESLRTSSDERSNGVSLLADETVARSSDEEETGELPSFWSSHKSSAASLAASHALDIVEHARSAFSFDDTLEPEAIASMAEKDETSNGSSGLRTKKRRRADTDEEMLELSIGRSATSSAKIGTKKSKKSESSQSTDPAASKGDISKGPKRENYRKINLKNGYKKPKMDRETAGYARARKLAASNARSAASEPSPFGLVEDASMGIDFESAMESAMDARVEAGETKPFEPRFPSSGRVDRVAELSSQLKDVRNGSKELSPELMDSVLVEALGVQNFRPGQREAISRVLRGQSTLLILPTGGGKSLCYQYPGLVFEEGITMVVSPLLSLMTDQLSKLPSRGLCGVALTSAMSYSDTQRSVEKLKSGEARILFVSPEKLTSQSFLALFQSLSLSINLLCVDEAHCISTWSHNFRPSYLQIRKYAVDTLGAKIVLALTATATAATAASIASSLGISEEGILRYHPIGEHVELNAIEAVDKYDKLERILKSPQLAPDKRVIVYVMFQRQADDLASYLAQKGFAAASYHAGKSSFERKAIQSKFCSRVTRVMVATIAFGMGVDVEDVRAVVHFGMPKSVENYVQEVGRAGRDGLAAHCSVLYSPSDIHLLRSLAHSDTLDRPTVKALLNAIFNPNFQNDLPALPFSVALPISQSEIKFDMKQSMIATILTWLANDGWLKFANVQILSSCDIAFLAESASQLAKKSKLLHHCFTMGTKTKTGICAPLDKVSQKMNISVEECSDRLYEVQEEFQLQLNFKDPSFSAEILRHVQGDELDDLIDKITAKVQQLESVTLAKIDSIHRLLTTDGTTPMHDKIRRYFEQNDVSDSDTLPAPQSVARAPSFANSALSGGSQTNSSIMLSDSMRSMVASDVRNFLASHSESIQNARQVARIFHGISSPQFPKEEWQLNRYWNKSVNVPFEAILAIAKEQLISALFATAALL